MGVLAFSVEARVGAQHALDRGRAARELAGASARLYAASLAGDARVLGAWQRREDLRVPALRRATGGPAVMAGDGIFYAALAMRTASVFMECPRDRVLNRNVRGFLAGLRAVGASAHYFGRESVSVDRRPAAMIAWTRRASGEVLVELFLGVERSFAVPDDDLAHPPRERMLGKVPITLRESLGAVPEERAIALAFAEAFARIGGLDLEERAIEHGVGPEEPAYDAGMCWSTREIPIGLAHAGIAIEGGVVKDAALAGDFFQDDDAPARLRAALAFGHPTAERVRDALNATYGRGGVVIEGVRTLQPVLEAFLELVA